MSLVFISQQIIIYSAMIYLVFGVIGNAISIYIFSSVSVYRRTPATFYFLIEAIFKNIYLLTNLLPRIIGYSYGYEFANISSLWCKFRQAILIMSSTVVVAHTCMSAVDQYLVTSSKAYLRQKSQIKMSHRSFVIIIIVCSLHAIPFFIYLDISPITKICASFNPILTTYFPIFSLVIICTMPILFMSVFGSLTYRNIRQTTVLAEHQADRQLVTMTFLDITLSFFCSAPLAIYHIYNIITSGMIKDQDRLLKEYFAYVIISTEITLYYALSFYIFLFSSSRFRRNVKERLFGKRQTNVILPNTQTK
ncbi:unnamed protein product [Adineta ricciae]|uniref:G-protein coupled receptors family 1 profile domain-containing protein n=1 Tax=Adineta ricciae TaxID=249248 RepID=A0A815M3X5_ADIRI|nr:unnamed protein product [Adineta ricciae]CAF1418814.1 unnamed protein product [Adineta ricciae]